MELMQQSIEALGLHDHPFWRERELSTSTHGSTNPQRPPRMHGHGKKARVLPNGLELEALPSDISLFQSIRQIVQIQQRKVFHGEILEILTPAIYDFLYQDNDVEKCPVEKADQLSTEHCGAATGVHAVDREYPQD